MCFANRVLLSTVRERPANCGSTHDSTNAPTHCASVWTTQLVACLMLWHGKAGTQGR